MMIRKKGYLIAILLCISAHVLAVTPADSLVKIPRYQALFGKKPLNKKDQEEVNQIITSVDQSFPNRAEGVKFLSERAWEYVGEGKLDTATFRFNLVHALDSTSVEAYWGLGVIAFQRLDFPSSIELLGKGLQINPKLSVMRVDYAIVKLSCYLKGMTCGTLEEVDALLSQALQEDPTNANAWMKKSQVAFLQEKYELAWSYFHECRALDLTQLDLNFSQQLMEKMPDPKGIFK
ncbi:tetratricopeptide repeat protein [Aquirufa rosea]|uniref:Uncharacterized protein n=1 Tax=Aquirufa rosea TaxID=2509241 RepID=A0A4Q1BZ96_9BACT|nr:hypothetical protein [Aquirufa rosea]RXK48880.1 hypothetical protein ESB04_07975 [Aquirufa rosea]